MADHPEREVVRRELDTDTDEPAVQIAEAVAEIEGENAVELPPMYDCVDGVLSRLFSDPPSPEAQMAVEFSYETYRITVGQNGDAAFVKTE